MLFYYKGLNLSERAKIWNSKCIDMFNESPILKLNSQIENIDDFNYLDFKFINYVSHPTIKATMAV
jgi:thymidylate synthase